LDGRRPKLGEDRLELPPQNLRPTGLDGEHSLWVLCGQAGNRARPVNPEHRKSLQVGLDPGAASAIGAGNRQGNQNLLSVLQVSQTHGPTACPHRQGQRPKECGWVGWAHLASTTGTNFAPFSGRVYYPIVFF